MRSFEKDNPIRLSDEDHDAFGIIWENINKEPKGPIPEAEMIEPKQSNVRKKLGGMALAGVASVALAFGAGLHERITALPKMVANSMIDARAAMNRYSSD